PSDRSPRAGPRPRTRSAQSRPSAGRSQALPPSRSPSRAMARQSEGRSQSRCESALPEFILQSASARVWSNGGYNMATQLQREIECSEAEWPARQDLAACYRIFDLLGWSESIYNHITLRVPGEEAFLINPFGLLWSEVT